MIGASAAAAVMLDGVAVDAEAHVTLGLPGEVYPDVSLAVTALSVTAATVTDLPEQSRMQVGYPQMTASFTLTGLVDQSNADRTAAWLFRRYSTDSPLYRTDALMAPVTIDIWLYPPDAGGVPEPVRKFTGLIDSYTESVDGAVEFSCVDNHGKLRSLPALPPAIGPFTSTAVLTQLLAGSDITSVLDASLNTLQVIPAIPAGADRWEVIQQVVAAELGVAGLDEYGVFRFWNRDTIRSRGVARTVTSAQSLSSVQVETLAAAVVNRAQVGYTTWTFNPPATVWELAGLWRVPRRSKRIWYATIAGGSLIDNIDTNIQPLPSSGTGTPGQSYYRVAIDSSGAANHPGITVTLEQTNPTRVKITATNATGVDAWFVASANNIAPPAGTPVLQIGGTPVTAVEEVVTDYQYPDADDGGAALSRFGEVVWQETGNPWIQDEDTAVQLGKDVVLDGYVPRPNLTNIQIQPDPRLQLTDVLHVQDPDVTFVDEYARIFGWTLTLAADAWGMSVDARTLAPPGAWILGVPGRSELGLTTYLQGV